MKFATFSIVLAGLLFALAASDVALAGVAYMDPGWDLTYDGASAEFGTPADTLTVGTGTWVRQSKNTWDGSAPGQVDPTLTVGPSGGGFALGDSPGGLVALAEGTTSYLRIQDTGDPTTVNPPGQDNGFVPWLDPSNRTLMFGHDIQKENPGRTSVMSRGLTFSFRARLASTGVLDDVYPDWDDGEVEFPDLQAVTPWPSTGKGYKVSDSAQAMFTVVENGTSGIGFSLVLDIDTPGDDGQNNNNGATFPGSQNIGGGLIMNNKPGGGFRGLPGSDRATLDSVNLVPMSDADLLDWHEFWITISNSDFDSDYDVAVYRDGSLVPDSFVAVKSNGVQTNHLQSVLFGLPSGTSWSAFDLDFLSYKLGVVAPLAVPEPTALALGVLAAVGFGWFGARGRRLT